MSGKSFPKRGQIFWADLEPARGAETQKIRPCLIVSNDIGNETSKLVMVAPITSKIQRIYQQRAYFGTFPFTARMNSMNARNLLGMCARFA